MWLTQAVLSEQKTMGSVMKTVLMSLQLTAELEQLKMGQGVVQRVLKSAVVVASL